MNFKTLELLNVLIKCYLKSETAEFVDKYVERLGDAWRGLVVALDDGLVGLGTAHNVVRLDGENLLQDVRCTEGFKGPNLHLSETLTTEVGLTAKGLLGDERVGSNATGVHLVVDHMVQLEVIDVTYRCRLVETLAGLAVVEIGAAVLGQTCLFN